MAVYISLLRAVNVGGTGKIKMDALRQCYADLGFPDAKSYVQSGNVVFTSDELDPAKLAKTLDDGIQQTFGHRADVVIRTPDQMRAIIAGNPFKQHEDEPRYLHVVFLTAAPAAADVEATIAANTGPEKVEVRGEAVYIFYTNGSGRSKLSLKGLKVPGTARNWNSVRKLVEIAEGFENT
jgi:uncharacterized protein (DUF1697 family)